MNRFKLLFLWNSLLFIGCTSVSPVEQALRLSGNNRIQLEQVLRHYSRCQKDSLKYKAACFLIENMPSHGWYEGSELDIYKRWIDSVYRNMNFVFKATLYEAFFEQPHAADDLRWYEDIENLDSNFLITYIDSTFSAIRRRPWLCTISFEQLCEYVLPYRGRYERPQQIYKWQDSLFNKEVIGMLECDDAESAYKVFVTYAPPVYSGVKDVEIQYHGKRCYYNILECTSQAIAKSWEGKLLLCPVALDLNPAFPNRNDRHCWAVMIDNTEVNSTLSLSSEVVKLGKIYRNTFARNSCPVCRNEEFIPPFFRSPFYRDVTSFYTVTEEVGIDPLIPVNTCYGYLCVFNDLKWEPVACTAYQNGWFRFCDVGRGVVYLPVVYPDQQAVAVSYPFILDLKGKVHTLQPDTTCLSILKLKRKYPFPQNIQWLNQKFVNSVVEASNDLSFKRKDSIGVFKKLRDMQWAFVKINNLEQYRYWRIRSEVSFVIAECLLYDQEEKSIKPFVFGNSKYYNNAFDDDPLTYSYAGKDRIFQWDMGEKISLSCIECLLRYDGNGIWPGHWYELNYYDGKGWCSLGTQEAMSRWVEFSGIPDSALLWLRDLTTGREERIFTYTDGKIHFW